MKVSSRVSWRLENALLFLFALPTVYFFLGSADIGKQVATVVMLAVGTLMLFYQRHIFIDYPVRIFALLAFYAAAVFILKGAILSGNIMPNDFAELMRLFGLLVFYILGCSFGNTCRFANLGEQTAFARKICWGLFLMLAIIAVSYYFRDTPLGILSRLYSSEEHRFSGIMPGINYIWLPLSIMCLSGLVAGLGLVAYFAIFSLTLGSLLLSASFTAIVATFVAIASYWVFRELLIRKNIFRVLISVVGVLVISYGLVSFFEFASESGVGMAGKFKLITQFITSGSIESFPSLVKRLYVWREVLSEVEKEFWFGHGPAKAELRFTDNSYLMTLFRYGALGLLLEITLYISFLGGMIYRLIATGSKLMLIPLSLLSAYLVAAITTNVFYELRAPYLLFLLVGYFLHVNVVSSDDREQLEGR